MAKREPKTIVQHESTCAAITDAFKQLKDIRPVNLERGSRVGNTLSTGSLMLDLALGGGFQRGRMADIFGPEGSGKSTLLQSIIASAQQVGIPIVHYDPETSADPTYMKAMGINLHYTIEQNGKIIPGYYYSQPSAGEEIYRHMLWTMNRMPVLEPNNNCGPTALFLIDSIAAMVTEKFDKDTGEGAGMGMDARMHSTYLKQLRGRLAKTGSLLVVSNQIRNKIGVLYGCFHGETMVAFADGTQHTIKEIVGNKLEGPVLSFNFSTKEYEAKKITKWFNNGKLDKNNGEKWLMFSTESPGVRGGRVCFTCTPNHHVYVANEQNNIKEINASDLSVGDKMVTWADMGIFKNAVYKDVIYGSLLGDGAVQPIRPEYKQGPLAVFALSNNEQPEYLSWKLELLKDLNFSKRQNKKGFATYLTKTRADLYKIRELFYAESSWRHIPTDLSELTPLMAAIWYMDDGSLRDPNGRTNGATISIKRLFKYCPQDVLRAAELLRNFIGCAEEGVMPKGNRRLLYIDAAAFRIFSKKIRAYVPECMQYKLKPKDRGFYKEINTTPLLSVLEPHYVKVTEKCVAAARKYRELDKFDLEVEDNHNYFVGGAGKGVLVHNSPEVEPGGEAIKFFPDYKLRISTRKVEPDKTNLQVRPFTARTIKNKTFPPFQEAHGAIILGRGIDKAVDADNFLASIGKLDIKAGKRRIELKQFDTGVYLSWKEFRAAVEQPEFRAACFDLLKQDKVYDAYFKQMGYLNYSYDTPEGLTQEQDEEINQDDLDAAETEETDELSGDAE